MRNAVFVTMILLSNASFGALIDYGDYIEDSESGLQWLDLKFTTGRSMVEARDQNSGWRFATNSEIEDLFNKSFDGYYDTSSSGVSVIGEGEYSDHLEDAQAFCDLFCSYSGGGVQAWGLYIDEDERVRYMGVYQANYNIYGLEHGDDFTSEYYENGSHARLGTYLVRTAVPLPAAAWMFGSGLVGLGFLRRRNSKGRRTAK